MSDAAIIRRTIWAGESGNTAYELQSTTSNNDHWRYFDARIYNNLVLTTNKSAGDPANTTDQLANTNYRQVGSDKALHIYPYQTYASYVGDYYETADSVAERIAELEEEKAKTKPGSDAEKAITDNIKEYEKRKALVESFIEKYEGEMIAPHSLVHPYAIIKLAGMHGDERMVQGSYLFDNFATRKWYEVDGDNFSSYAKTPTTTKIIAWGNQDPAGRVPYSFQDFVFCKDWNIIPNNRMITLRRYFAPVSDNIEFDNYKEYDVNNIIADNQLDAEQPLEKTNMPFAPLATAITYFGEGTGNELSSLLNFTAGYNWEAIQAESSPITIDAQANDMGNGLIGNNGTGILSGAMQAMSFMTGFTKALSGELNSINAASNAVPPDPYTNGPYENRILGPVNVIMDTIKRKRGLSFKQDSIKIKFNYIARPIAGVNNKAVLLDLLANILLMCYASGTWFGGLERFRSNNRTVYPFTAGKVMNKLYKGQLFGKEGAIRTATSQAWDQGLHGLGDVLSEAMTDMKNLVSSMWNEVMSIVDNTIGNKDAAEKRKKKAKNDFNSALNGKAITGFQSVLAARVLRGASIPWISGKKALLTGDPVGEWHLTIGNPLNPIAMIGNLVCDGVSIKWSDELGPDDFPIGFEAEVTLKHGLGRDKDAIESMYNRGYGRIYTLPQTFRGSADFETKVDQYTGGQNTEAGRRKYDEWSATYFGGGGASITEVMQNSLYNTGASTQFPGLRTYKSFTTKDWNKEYVLNPVHVVTPFQMQWIL